jgi:hypothetical protein
MAFPKAPGFPGSGCAQGHDLSRKAGTGENQETLAGIAMMSYLVIHGYNCHNFSLNPKKT